MMWVQPHGESGCYVFAISVCPFQKAVKTLTFTRLKSSHLIYKDNRSNHGQLEKHSLSPVLNRQRSRNISPNLLFIAKVSLAFLHLLLLTMATLALPQTSISAVPSSPEPVDVKQFTALEQKVDTLVAQLQQIFLSQGNQGQFNLKKQRPNFQLGGFVPSLPLSPENSLPVTPALEAQVPTAVISERPSTRTALEILDIIQRYGHNVGSKSAPAGSWTGKSKFVAPVEAHVLKNEPVRMVLPAFPFKSPNRKDKVLGNMPDLGEELALMHLNGLCESIAEIYEPGATVFIASDGLVYNGKCQL